jgi:hypothetical protein
MYIASPLARLISVLLVITFFSTSACTSLQPASQVAIGDEVRVTDKNGARIEFVVTAVETDALRGADVRIARQDIATLEVRRFSIGRTITLAAIGAGVMILAAGALVADLYDDLWEKGTPRQ